MTNKIRRGDEWGLNRMIIVAGCNQCDCATVIGLIRVWMNTLVQFRGSTQQQRPYERCRHEGYETGPTHIRPTRVHRATIFRQRIALRKQFCFELLTMIQMACCAVSRKLSGERGVLPCDSRLKGDMTIAITWLRGRSTAHALRPFRVLVVSVLI